MLLHLVTQRLCSLLIRCRVIGMARAIGKLGA
jgi:hypothetical protein